MSRTLIDRNSDLSRLLQDGYNIQVTDANFLLVHDVPYVTSGGTVATGVLATNLELAGDNTVQPQDHTAKFIGEYPCDSAGQQMAILVHQSADIPLGSGFTAKHSFSRKPACGHYIDYYEKMTHYVSLLMQQVVAIDPEATAKTFRVIESAIDEGPHVYLETASARAEIVEVTAKLAEDAVAIVGLGGTGSYVLDLVAKTPVKRIHLFDADEFLTHNAFRAPGAADLEDLRRRPSKVDYYKGIYERMHRGIVCHPVRVDATNASMLAEMSFVFLCMESGPEKRAIIDHLEQSGVPFTDVGMGLFNKRGSIGGLLRTVLSLPDNREQARSRISFAADDAENEYDRNIQIAELNALNACFAVIAWKKHRRFYFDLGKERFTSYSVTSSLHVKSDIAE
jgi:hypothetical protein